jgi:hypothetical protein
MPLHYNKNYKDSYLFIYIYFFLLEPNDIWSIDISIDLPDDFDLD